MKRVRPSKKVLYMREYMRRKKLGTSNIKVVAEIKSPINGYVPVTVGKTKIMVNSHITQPVYIG